jgi:uncharacterized repeat protein (TIGR01451 family)
VFRSLFPLVAALALLAARPAPASAQLTPRDERESSGCAAPSIDGSLQDMIDFASCIEDGCGHVVNDDTQDVCVTDPLVDPCVALTACAAGGVGYFLNGTDITRAVAVYDRPNDLTYLGMRTTGQIGDADGDGTDFIGGTCNGTNINDQQGIGSNEPYIWSFDLDCDGIFGEASNNEPIVQVANNVVTVQNHTFGATSFDYVGPTGGTDLEASVAGLGLPAIWRVRAFIGFTFDGKSEDLAVSPLCPEPNLGLTVVLDCPGVICAGGQGSVTATVTNTSDVALANVALSIPLPAGLTFVGITDQDGWDTAGGGASVTASESSLPIAGVRTLVFTVQMEATCTTETKTLTGTANGSFSQPGCVELSGTQGQGSCDIRCSEGSCDITGDNVICVDETTEFCGPAGQSSYSWTGPGGFTASTQCTGPINVAGQYNLTVGTGDGCQASCSRTLTVNQLPVCGITGDNVICVDEFTEFCGPAGLASYSWTGPGGFTSTDQCTGAINVAGQYNLTIVDANGCDNSCSRTLTVNQLPVCSITGNAAICGGQKSTEFCGPAGMSSYSWTGPGGFTASTQCTGQIAVAGQYNLTIVDANGCDNTCSRTLTVDQPPVCDISGDNVICVDETTQFCAFLDLAGSLLYAWTGPGGFTASTECTGPINVAGQYNVTITDENGCTGSCSRTLTVNQLPVCGITGDNVICVDETSSFCGPAGMSSYSWTGPGGFTASTQCTGPINVAGQYNLTIVDANGCDNTCNRTLTVHQLPVCGITGDNVICGGQKDTNFCGPAGMSSYAWTGPGGFTASTQCTGSISVAGQYNLTIVDANGCDNTCNRTLSVDTPPPCDITGCTEIISGGEPSEFCGPAGLSSYAWTGPGGFTASTRCTGPISEPGQYNLVVEDENGCSCENSRTLTESSITCSISGENEICEGEETQLCGPVGLATYAWTGPGGFTASTQCITVGTEGLYTLEIHNVQGCEASCEITLVVEPCAGACPRTPGFWKQQYCYCGEGEGGRVKFGCGDLNAILGCIGTTSSYTFGSGGLTISNFCSALNKEIGSSPQEQQVNRQYAAFLSNVCVGELAIPAGNGDIVSLPPSTVITGACSGLIDATTIADLIDAVDALLAGPNPPYGDIITCLDRINNGVGIPFDPEACVAPGNDVNDSFVREGLIGSAQTGLDSGLGAADLFKPTPNPFKQNTRMAYAVSASAGAQVEIGVYNTAGQKIRTLVNGVVGSGRHEAVWDGRDENGTAVPAGIYFYRAVIDGQSIVARVTYIR